MVTGRQKQMCLLAAALFTLGCTASDVPPPAEDQEPVAADPEVAAFALERAEIFVICAGAYDAMSVILSASGDVAQARVLNNLGNGAGIAAAVIASMRYERSVDWVTGRSEVARDMFLAEIERLLQSGTSLEESELAATLAYCNSLRDEQEAWINLARDQAYGG